MEFVPAPVLVVPIAIALTSHVALAWQIGQHCLQRHAALALQARIGGRRVGRLAPFVAFVRATRTWQAIGARRRSLRLARGVAGGLSRRPLRRRLRVVFAGCDRSGIARDVTNQAVLLGFRNQGFMHELGQLHARKLFERS